MYVPGTRNMTANVSPGFSVGDMTPMEAKFTVCCNESTEHCKLIESPTKTVIEEVMGHGRVYVR